jgi:hypothetical protein
MFASLTSSRLWSAPRATSPAALALRVDDPGRALYCPRDGKRIKHGVTDGVILV